MKAYSTKLSWSKLFSYDTTIELEGGAAMIWLVFAQNKYLFISPHATKNSVRINKYIYCRCKLAMLVLQVTTHNNLVVGYSTIYVHIMGLRLYSGVEIHLHDL